MSQYLVLIYEDEKLWADTDLQTAAGIIAEHKAFGRRHGEAMRGGSALHATSTATSVRPDGQGGFLVTDGPFVESKEAVGGYYVLEAESLDEALELAKQIPAPFGGLEIRPHRVIE